MRVALLFETLPTSAPPGDGERLLAQGAGERARLAGGLRKGRGRRRLLSEGCSRSLGRDLGGFFYSPRILRLLIYG